MSEETEEAKDAPKGEEKDEEEPSVKSATDPRESDVLCGRGGAALRHPGNQTYRRLVNLNKQLYITCLKTEKLKISRSIVAAIREQDGRFLERDTKKGTWYDIGDKKAIEKTSQALREGQPKLRQKMIASGQIPPESGISIEQQFSNGIYSPRGSLEPVTSGNFSGTSGSFSDPAMAMQQMHSGQSQQQSNGMSDMPPPPARTASIDMSSAMTPDMMMQRLSLSRLPPNSIPSWTPSINAINNMAGAGPGPGSFRGQAPMPSWTPSMNSYMSAMSDARSVKSRLRPSLTTRGSGVANELGMPDTNLSILSDYSAYGAMAGGMNDDRYGMEYAARPDEMNYNQYPGNSNGNSNPQPPPPPAMSPMMDSPSLRSSFDRRRVFAKMHHRPGSVRMRDSQHSIGADGMPDIHMVDSTFSLLSNVSGHGKDALASYSNHGMKESEHSVGLGSRRSLMSGLSKISDSSDAAISVFSDLSKKFGPNVSTRSIAMSEVSGIEEGDDVSEDFQDTFNFDSIM